MKTKELYDKYLITGMVAGFEPVEVGSASGCTIKDVRGTEYLDCFGGISVTNAGHCHPAVNAAAKKQIDELVHCCSYVYYSPRTGELAKVLADITPGKLQKSFFGNSGAEAVEGALRLAKQFTGKKEIICLTQSFHGRTAATLSITGNRLRKKGSGPYLSGIAFAPAPNCYRCPFKMEYPKCGCACAEFVDHVFKYQTAGDVAAFIFEPILGEGGILPPPKEYFKIVSEIVKTEEALLICDEVQTGFGRTGKLFAIEHYGVEPEIMTMAKGIADGFPIGAFIAREDVGNSFTPGDHLSTFGGSPVSCAASMANIEVLKKEKLVENSAARGKQLMNRLDKFGQDNPLVGDVRGKGLMIGIELVENKADKTPAADKAKAVRDLCRENGVLVGRGGPLANVIRLQPPLCITAEQADQAGTILEKAITEITTC